jgi:hypothetical protein
MKLSRQFNPGIPILASWVLRNDTPKWLIRVSLDERIGEEQREETKVEQFLRFCVQCRLQLLNTEWSC